MVCCFVVVAVMCVVSAFASEEECPGAGLSESKTFRNCGQEGSLKVQSADVVQAKRHRRLDDRKAIFSSRPVFNTRAYFNSLSLTNCLNGMLNSDSKDLDKTHEKLVGGATEDVKMFMETLNFSEFWKNPNDCPDGEWYHLSFTQGKLWSWSLL